MAELEMDPGQAAARGPAAPRLGEAGQEKLLAGGSALGALVVSSCCLLPLALFGLGVTGAWIGNLTALYPYKIYFLIPTAAFLAGGFYKVYGRSGGGGCADGECCAAPLSRRLTKAVLWSASLLVLAALAFPYVAPWLLDI